MPLVYKGILYNDMGLAEMELSAARHAALKEKEAADAKRALVEEEEALHQILTESLDTFGVKEALETVRDIWGEGEVTPVVGIDSEGFVLTSDPFPHLTVSKRGLFSRVTLDEKRVALKVVAAMDETETGEKTPVIKASESPARGVVPHINSFSHPNRASNMQSDVRASGIDGIPNRMNNIQGAYDKPPTVFAASVPAEVDRFNYWLLLEAKNRERLAYLPKDIRKASELVVATFHPALRERGKIATYGRVWAPRR